MYLSLIDNRNTISESIWTNTFNLESKEMRNIYYLPFYITRKHLSNGFNIELTKKYWELIHF